MRIVEGIGTGVLLLLLALLLAVALIFVRRMLIVRRGGTIGLSIRLSTFVPGRGWAAGLGRFVGDELRWYRIFSFSPFPRRVLSRRGLSVERRRAPDGPERLVLPSDWVVVRCLSHQAPLEIAMAEPALTGFQSWVEAGPPGGAAPGRSRRSRAS